LRSLGFGSTFGPMLLNRVETALMNNPVREMLQRHYEVRKLIRMGGRVEGKRCLEVGCGRGVGVEQVLDQFGAASVDAFDLDDRMVKLARQRLARRGDRVKLWQGSVTNITAPDATYDAVFDFGIIHHVPDWRAALAEVHRVLVPGGRFFVEEVLAHFIHHPLWSRLLDHPMHDRFDRATFAKGLEGAGFRVVESEELLGDFAWFVADKPAS
jgi:ubiquinone/menaquinone biosynthesis C-methylase UbiE